MVESFDHRFIVDMDMRDRCSNTVLDTSICNYEGISYQWGWFNGKIIKLLSVKLEKMITTLRKRMKRKAMRKVIYNSATRSEFWVKWIKWGKNLIKPIIHIDNMTFDETTLLLSERVEWHGIKVMIKVGYRVRDDGVVTYQQSKNVISRKGMSS